MGYLLGCLLETGAKLTPVVCWHVRASGIRTKRRGAQGVFDKRHANNGEAGRH